ncbi:hypothetical protein G7046_g3739 [Stylonectria norvegica]|nr:hypothetical protein G7046_g3739 [Stylonectria norvegica]
MSSSSASHYRSQRWTKGQFFVSTDPSQIPLDTLNAAFASDVVPWASRLPEPDLREMIHNSLCFGLYKQDGDQPPTMIGFSRCITDFVTFLYLTDVWVDLPYQGDGLGRWLVGCVHESIDSMPHLRRSMLITGGWERTVPFYEKIMGMKVLETQKGQGLAVMECKGRGGTTYGDVEHNE